MSRRVRRVLCGTDLWFVRKRIGALSACVVPSLRTALNAPSGNTAVPWESGSEKGWIRSRGRECRLPEGAVAGSWKSGTCAIGIQISEESAAHRESLSVSVPANAARLERRCPERACREGRQ